MFFLRTILMVLLFTGVMLPQSLFPSFYAQNEFSLTAPGAMRYGLYGYDNPALLSTLTSPDFLFTWSDQNGWNSINHWGIFAAFPNFSFTVNNEKASGFTVTDYKLNAAAGNQTIGLGFGYGWSNGAESEFGRSNLFTLGTFLRPTMYFSAGIVGNFPADGFNEAVIDAAIRPWGNEVVSVFGDYVFRESRPENDIKWSAGIAAEPIAGIRITGRYFDNKFMTAGIEYSFGHFGISAQARFDEKKYLYNTYGIRIGAYDRNLFDHLKDKKAFAEMNLLGGMKYQRFIFFDDSNTLLDFLNYIRAAREDKTSAGVVLNLSGMNINREMIWELRKELSELKSAGKKVYIYFDRLDFNGYHLASVADKIFMDPVGNLTLEGFAMGRTYFTGTLDKIGIGFHELRYFKYKSAYESFSRTEMSEADEVQWQALVDSYYETAASEISTSRNLSPILVDSIVNNNPFFLPDNAVKMGLVDSIVRWDKVKDIVRKFEGNDKYFTSPGSLPSFKNPRDDYWGEKPKIAVIYALGVCAMDEGINSRQLVKQVEAALTDQGIKAIVLRVDSPGGDALASDLISEKIKEYKGKKPVIISQGYVAASGGYWLSMYGDTIVAAPTTISGSIGVIGAWVYNDGLKDKIGVTTDYVKRGTHADLPFGMTVPFIGLTIPDRDLSESEENIFRSSIESHYTNFVSKVAEGRDMKYDEVHEVAQGRVWSGRDGFKNGLIDVLGNLNTAIDLAAEQSGLSGEEYEVIELPKPGLFNFNVFVPKIIGIEIETRDPNIDNLMFRIKNMGMPMPMIPLEFSNGMIMQY